MLFFFFSLLCLFEPGAPFSLAAWSRACHYSEFKKYNEFPINVIKADIIRILSDVITLENRLRVSRQELFTVIT